MVPLSFEMSVYFDCYYTYKSLTFISYQRNYKYIISMEEKSVPHLACKVIYIKLFLYDNCVSVTGCKENYWKILRYSSCNDVYYIVFFKSVCVCVNKN